MDRFCPCRAWRAALTLGFGLLTLAGAALADEPAAVRVILPACDSAAFDVDAFSRAVRLELLADGVETVDVTTDVATLGSAERPVHVATVKLEASPCSDQAAAVDVVLVDELTSKTVRRQLTVRDLAPGARARVLALAAAELLRASWRELGMVDAPGGAMPVPPSVRLATMAAERSVPTAPLLGTTPETVATQASPRAAASPPSVRLDVAVDARFFPTFGSALVGPGAALSIGSGERIPLRLRLDAEALLGTSYDPLGSIAVTLVTGGAAVVLAHHTGPFDVELGPHVAVGWGGASGDAASATTQATSTSRPIVHASAAFALRLLLGGAYSASLAGDLGGVLRGLGAQADGRRASGFGGPMAGFGIGLGRSF